MADQRSLSEKGSAKPPRGEGERTEYPFTKAGITSGQIVGMLAVTQVLNVGAIAGTGLGDVNLSGGLNVNTSGAAAGEIKTAGDIILADAKALKWSDVNLYRGAANQLKTDDDFCIADGKKLLWSDVNLYRSAANMLKTDDELTVALGLHIGDVVGSGGALELGADTWRDSMLTIDILNGTTYDGHIAFRKQAVTVCNLGMDATDVNLKIAYGGNWNNFAAGTKFTFASTGNFTATGSLTAAGALVPPVGAIFAFGGASAPTGYLLCDGTQYLNSSYPDLAAVLGTTYGGDATHFNVPDLRGRPPVGKGTHADVDALGDSDGVAVGSRTPNHTHSTPNHTHTQNMDTTLRSGVGTSGNIGAASGSNAQVLTYGGTDGGAVYDLKTGTVSGGGGTSGSGNGGYVVVNFIIKI